MDPQKEAQQGKTEKTHYRDQAKQQFPAKKGLTGLCSPAVSEGWVRRLGLWGPVLRERTGADCLSDTLRGLAQHSRGRPGKLWGHQKNKGSFLQEDSNSAL